MHRLALTSALVIVLAVPVSAQEAPSLNLNEVCSKGCVVLIKFDEGAHFGADSDFAGEFTPTAVNNPLAYFEGMDVTETGQMVYRLTSEAGMPMFWSIADVQAYMTDKNEDISDAPAS